MSPEGTACIRLKREYLKIPTEDGYFYGGNQRTFRDARIRTDGCGLIAAADVLWYLRGEKAPASEAEYQAYVARLRPLFHFFPNHGMPGWALCLGMNRALRQFSLPYRIRWGAFPVTRYDDIFEMLQNDIPVITAIGPNFPNRSGKKPVVFYEKKDDGSFEAAAETRGHYVVITGACKGWLRISSWGKEYYIRWSEFEHYARKHSFFLFTNVCRMTGLRKKSL